MTILADRVKQTTATTGTGTLTLDASVPTGFRSFVSGIGNGNTCYYAIYSSIGDWEVGLGTVTSGASDTLSRDTVLSSSNSNALVPFLSGTKTVYSTAPGAFLTNLVSHNGTPLTSGRVPYSTTNGRLTDSANLTFNATGLTISTSLGIGTAANAAYQIYAAKTYDGTTVNNYSLNFSPALNPTNDGSAQLFSLSGYPTMTGSKNASALYGIFLQPTISHTAGTLGSIQGLTINPNFTSASAGTTTNAFGIWLQNIYKDPASTEIITNQYQLYIDTPTKGATNNYAIYSAGGLNYFGGHLGIGTTTTATAIMAIGGSEAVQNNIGYNNTHYNTYTPTGSENNYNVGVYLQNRMSGTSNTSGVVTLYGTLTAPTWNGTITAVASTSAIYGTYIGSSYTGAGTLPAFYGMRISDTINNAAAIVTNHYGIRIFTPTVTAGALTNNYGLYIDSHSTGGTTNYNIYSAGPALNYFGGSIGVGVAPSSTYIISAAATSTDTTKVTFNGTMTSNTTVDGTHYYYGLQYTMRHLVATGATESGGVTCLTFNNFRNFTAAGSDDSGTLNSITGITVQYGHNSTNAAAVPLTTTSYGVYISPYHQTGTIATNYGIYIATGSAGGTITTNYGIYQQDTAAKNYFGGNIGLGTAPTTTDAFKISKSFSDTSGTNSGIYSFITATTATTNSTNFYGFYPTLTYTGAGNNSGLISGFLSTSTITSNATISEVNGGRVIAQVTATNTPAISYWEGLYLSSNSRSGTITQARTLACPLTSVTTGTITTSYGLHVRESTKGAGTITNQYGIYIDSIANGSTLNYSIYSAGGTNYLAGNLGIGIAPTAYLHLKAGTTAASTSPLKFTSGTLMTNPEAGAIEFLTDKFYGTITTGAVRKEFAFTLAEAATQTSSFTAVVDNLYPVDLSGAGATFAVTFPATPTAGDRFGFYVKVEHATHAYSVAPITGGSAPSIRGITTHDNVWSLWILGEKLVFRYDGSTWQLEEDERIAQRAGLKLSADAVMSVSVWTTIPFDGASFDNCHITTTGASAHITPKRKNDYVFHLRARVASPYTATTTNQRVFDGSSYTYEGSGPFSGGASAGSRIYPQVAAGTTLYPQIYSTTGTIGADSAANINGAFTGFEICEELGGGSGSTTGGGLLEGVAQTASFTAINGYLYPVDLSGAGATFAVTFPATPAAGYTFGLYVKVAHATHSYSVAPITGGSAPSIRGTTSHDNIWSLWILGEKLVFRYDGTTWQLETDGRIPMICSAYKSTNETVSSGWTRLTLDTAIKDSCHLLTTGASARITVKRKGDYLANVIGQPVVVPSAGALYGVRVYDGTNAYAIIVIHSASIYNTLVANGTQLVTNIAAGTALQHNFISSEDNKGCIGNVALPISLQEVLQ